jgi:DUF917 family protein
MWELDEEKLEAITIGAGILGTGGGGNPYYGKLYVRRLLREGRRVTIVSPEDVSDDALVVSVGGMGAPTIGIERIHRGDEPLAALRALEAHLGRRATPSRSGGDRGERTRSGRWPSRPSLICQWWTVTGWDAPSRNSRWIPSRFTESPRHRRLLADIFHNLVVFPWLQDAVTLERYARAVTVQMGGAAGFAFPAMSGADLRRTVIPYTVTLALRLGEAVLRARREHHDPIAAALAVTVGASSSAAR